MKRWLLALAAVAAAAIWSGMPFTAGDVGKLRPLELVCITRGQEGVRILGDTGDAGWGKNVAEAFADMKRSCPGELFLDTADYLVLGEGAEALLPEAAGYLRPACRVCVGVGVLNAEELADYLGAHQPETTIRSCKSGERMPVLRIEEGRMGLD